MNAKVKLEPACFVIKSFEEVGRAIAYMHRHHADALSDGKPLVVRIDQKQEDRSKAQNRLLHMWFGEIAKFTGDDPESIKFEMKKKFLTKIYLRDRPETLEAYEAVIGYRDAVRNLDGEEKKIHEVKYQRIIRMFINDHVKSSKANKQQFSEFCDKIHAFANVKLGVYLTCPDDLKYTLEYKEHETPN